MSKVVFDKLLGLQLSHNHVNLNGDTMTGALTNTLASGNSLVWDTNTLIVDATNHRVGIGTTTPVLLLEVSGSSAPRIRITNTANDANVGLQLSAKDSNGIAGTAGYYYVKGTTNATTYLALSSDDITSAMIVDKSGNIGIGTTGPTSVLHVVKTLGTSGIQTGVDFEITSAGSAAANQYGSSINLLPGYTGGSQTFALNFSNTAAGTGTNGFGAGNANYGVLGLTYGTTTGDNVGMLGMAQISSGKNFGGLFRSTTGTLNVGVAGVTGTGTTKVGGYFGLSLTEPTWVSAALLADNSSVAAPIFVARNNGTEVFRIDNGGNVGIGTTAPTNLLSLGGDSARTFWMERTTTAATAGFSLTIQSGGAVAGGTDKNGGDLILAPGLSTGTGNTKVRLQAATKATSTGTADNSLIDRLVITGSKALTDAATSLFDITLLAGQMTGGVVMATIEASDGTDHQAYTQVITFAAVNKGGVYTTTVTANANNDAKAVSAGTLTTSWALATGTNKVTLQVTPTGSLTETTYRVTYMVINNSPQAITIL